MHCTINTVRCRPPRRNSDHGANSFLSRRFFGNERALMTKPLALLILLAGSLVQVRVQSAGSPSTATETEFNKLCEEFIAGYLAWRPQTGTTLGLHEYDGKLTEYSRASLDAELTRLKRFDQQL